MSEGSQESEGGWKSTYVQSQAWWGAAAVEGPSEDWTLSRLGFQSDVGSILSCAVWGGGLSWLCLGNEGQKLLAPWFAVEAQHACETIL